MSFRTKELQEAAKAVFTTTKMILVAEARHSRVTVVGGLAVVQLTHYYRAIQRSAKNLYTAIFYLLINRITGRQFIPWGQLATQAAECQRNAAGNPEQSYLDESFWHL